MEKPPQQTLEELIHRELSKLPARPAPETLLPRILARIQAQERRRWWQRPWTQWPLNLQLAAIPVMLASVSGALFAVSFLYHWIVPAPDFSRMASSIGPYSAIWDVVSALGNAVLVLGRAVGEQWLLLSLVVPLAMYLACVGVGTLAYRMAVQSRR
jgi:hypothetical protein